MQHKSITRLSAALMLCTAPLASATELVILHGWSSPAEVGALGVIKDAFEAKGHTWIDLAIPHDTSADVGLVNLITGGNAPNIFIEANPGVYRDLTKMGMGQPLTEFFAGRDITAHFPPAVTQAITIDGEIMKIPTAIHIDGMLYYNIEAAAKAGVDPTKWDSLDAMFADFPKIRDAGIIPLGVGAQTWQIGYLTHALVAAMYGDALFPKIYSDAPDRDALASDDMRGVLAMLRQWQTEADEGSANRDWNVTTNMVITGQALMQIHGDWMKGEWRTAGKEAGKDFGCINIPGTKGLSVTVDSFCILGGVEPVILEAELEFAATVVDPVVSAGFAALKGSSPVRLDVDPASLDICSQAVLEAIKTPGKGFVTPHNLTDADWIDAIWNVMFNYWSDPAMTADTAIESLQSEYDAIWG